MPDLEAGVAAAQEADVFVGVHGANMANAWLMRSGSSTIEVTPFQFGHMGGSFGMSNRNGMVGGWAGGATGPAARQQQRMLGAPVLLLPGHPAPMLMQLS